MNPLKATNLSLLTALMLTCIALSPQAQADCQEGCDLGLSNTFLGIIDIQSNSQFRMCLCTTRNKRR
jgi:hypothetical protein